MNIIDITIPLSEKMPVWEGDKKVNIDLVEKIGDNGDFNVSRIELGVHSGTHIDSPYHVLKDGNTVDKIPLNVLIGKVQVVQVPYGNYEINAKCLEKIGIDFSIERILFRTSNSDYWKNDPYSFNKKYVALNTEGAQFLADRKVRLIGIDYFSISTFNDLVQPHVILLEKNIVLLENIDLGNVSPGIYQLVCLPIKLVGTEAAPVRAVLISD
jgi:arylformamidase